jgi:hypothetical protein
MQELEIIPIPEAPTSMFIDFGGWAQILGTQNNFSGGDCELAELLSLKPRRESSPYPIT